MRLLFLTHRLPCPPDRGCTVRSAAILQWLARHHEVSCAGFLHDTKQEAVQSALRELKQSCVEVAAVPFPARTGGMRLLSNLIMGGTATEGYFHSAKLERVVQQWTAQRGFDAVFAFSSCMAPLALSVPAGRRVLCMDDLDSRKWADLAASAAWPMRSIYRVEARRLSAREREWIVAFDVTLMVSAREAALVESAELRQRVHVLPAGLPWHVAADDERRPFSLPREPVVGFVGAMDYEPNIDAACWFAEAIWPEVRAAVPDAEFWIVGRSPHRRVQTLAGRPGITVTGAVPAIEPYLARMRVHVAPVRVSRGVQMKVLTAMAAGVPAVVTPAVAEGIGGAPGRDYLVAAEPSQFISTIVELLKNDSRAVALGRAARTFIRRQQHEAEASLVALDRILGGDDVSRSGGARTHKYEYDTTPGRDVHEESPSPQYGVTQGAGCD